MPFIAIGLLIAAALGGGTAVLAEHAMPGDPLWGFKVNIDEGVAGALSSSQSAKADWDLAAIQTRLSEAQALAQNGTLDAGAQAAISTNMEGHIAGIETDISNLKKGGDPQDAADAAARFQAEMANGASTLATTDASANSTVQATLTPLLSSVRSTLDDASGISAQLAAQVHLNP